MTVESKKNCCSHKSEWVESDVEPISHTLASLEFTPNFIELSMVMFLLSETTTSNPILSDWIYIDPPPPDDEDIQVVLQTFLI